jgi:hypothetical protein
MTLFERRRLLLACFSQSRSAFYARHMRMLRDDYLGTWLGRLAYDRRYLIELIEQSSALAEIHALNARMLMGWQED